MSRRDRRASRGTFAAMNVDGLALNAIRNKIRADAKFVCSWRAHVEHRHISVSELTQCATLAVFGCEVQNGPNVVTAKQFQRLEIGQYTAQNHPGRDFVPWGIHAVKSPFSGQPRAKNVGSKQDSHDPANAAVAFEIWIEGSCPIGQRHPGEHHRQPRARNCCDQMYALQRDERRRRCADGIRNRDPRM